MNKAVNNRDKKVIKDFGQEWNKFDQSKLDSTESELMFNSYFKIFPSSLLKPNMVGYDMGCGSGRWAKHIAPKVKKLYCVDPSNSINIAKINLSNLSNCIFMKQNVYDFSLKSNSMDFGYCLGVLHHVQDTEKALKNCVSKLKSGSPLLIYLYYSFENRPFWFKIIWNFTNIFRKFISILPFKIKSIICDLLAILIYFPLTRIYILLEKINFNNSNLPLWEYRRNSFYSMRTDSLDRFGTKVEKRFSKKQIENLMKNSGLIKIKFSNEAPFWCAIGYKK